jgi:hypothetical protein
VLTDDARAIALYRRGCELDSPVGCGNLGARYFLGNGVARDYQKTAHLFTRACAGEMALSCASLAQMYATPPSSVVKQDLARAAELDARAGQLGYRPSCARPPSPSSSFGLSTKRACAVPPACPLQVAGAVAVPGAVGEVKDSDGVTSSVAYGLLARGTKAVWFGPCPVGSGLIQRPSQGAR